MKRLDQLNAVMIYFLLPRSSFIHRLLILIYFVWSQTNVILDRCIDIYNTLLYKKEKQKNEERRKKEEERKKNEERKKERTRKKKNEERRMKEEERRKKKEEERKKKKEERRRKKKERS